MIMEVPIIKIGNSRGFRLSKAILEEYNIKDKVELVFEKNHIVIKPVSSPREGWDEVFRQMHEAEEDTLLFDDIFEDENLDEWT
jgi:antitoxin MazE